MPLPPASLRTLLSIGGGKSAELIVNISLSGGLVFEDLIFEDHRINAIYSPLTTYENKDFVEDDYIFNLLRFRRAL